MASICATTASASLPWNGIPKGQRGRRVLVSEEILAATQDGLSSSNLWVMNIGTVVEGPTDRLVLQAVLNELVPGEHRYLPLQPPVTFGERGTSWKGVRRWCRDTWQRAGSSLDTILSGDTGPALDLLVIHLDADVASEHDLQEDEADPIPDVAQPCPPIEPTVERLRCLVGRWLRRDKRPTPVVLVIPAQDTEHWTFAALFPADDLCTRADYECATSKRADQPGFRLTLKEYGKLLQCKGGQIKKTARTAVRAKQGWLFGSGWAGLGIA